MKQSSYSRRSRGRGSSRRGGASSGNRVIDSSGPETKVRGNIRQVWEKYLALARDAASSGDRILSEGYYQHAEHYYRMINAMVTDGGEAGSRKGKGQSSAQGSNGRRRQGGNGESCYENGAEAEVIPAKPSEETSPENSKEMSKETLDGREALAVFPDTSEPESENAQDGPVDDSAADADESDPVTK